MARQFSLFTAALLGAMLLTGCATQPSQQSTILDRRTPGTVIDDELIEIRGVQAFFQDKAINEQTHINVTSYNGIILLSGEAPTEALKQRATTLVSNIEKVRQVYNEVRAAAPSTLGVRGSDAYLSAKVKTALFAHGNVPAHLIKVVTENSTVFLMGLTTRAEADAATNVARKIGGVQRVVKLFEYIR
ncbi:MAG: BON domain-containing protein [Gammaproteobacteria bacterium]|nr:BON domain-containing protein [Gammaproteobacteria bacterium]